MGKISIKKGGVNRSGRATEALMDETHDEIKTKMRTSETNALRRRTHLWDPEVVTPYVSSETAIQSSIRSINTICYEGRVEVKSKRILSLGLLKRLVGREDHPAG